MFHLFSRCNDVSLTGIYHLDYHKQGNVYCSDLKHVVASLRRERRYQRNLLLFLLLSSDFSSG